MFLLLVILSYPQITAREFNTEVMLAINKSFSIKDEGQQIQPEDSIRIHNLAFLPKVKVVKAGTKITWINQDTAMHTVHSGTPKKPIDLMASGNLGKGDTFSYLFKEKGTYQYYCTTHPTVMQGTIIVK